MFTCQLGMQQWPGEGTVSALKEPQFGKCVSLFCVAVTEYYRWNAILKIKTGKSFCKLWYLWRPSLCVKTWQRMSQGKRLRGRGQGIHLRAQNPRLTRLAGQWIPGICLSLPPNIGVTTMHSRACFLCECGGFEFRFLCLQSKHSYRTRHLPGPPGSVFYYYRWLELE